jgi:DNA replication protein DnaC
MLHHTTIEKLHDLRLSAMAEALQEQHQSKQHESLSFEERLGLLVDRELTRRENNRTRLRLSKATLRWGSTIHDIDFNSPRGLQKTEILALANCRWIQYHENCAITGPTGTGKTFIACALAHSACSQGYRTRYLRAPKLFQELEIARNDGRHPKLMATLARLDLLIIDEWAACNMTHEDRRDIFELFEERYQRHAIMLVSQLPIDDWHKAVGDPTMADAILDRLLHNAHKIRIEGESFRKKIGVKKA